MSHFSTRSLAILVCLAALTTSGHATSFTFVPSTPDFNDLDHTRAYTWGITSTSTGAPYSTLVSQLNAGQKIASATLTISNLYNWSAADTNNQLFIHLLDNPKTSVNSVVDDPTDNGINQGVLSDYFGGKLAGNQVSGSWVAYGYASNGSLLSTGATNILLTQWHDNDGPNTITQFAYSFSGAQLTTLTSYILNGHTGGSGYADFGLGLDADCHYYNSGVQLSLTTAPVPDSSATATLLLGGLVSLLGFRRRFAANACAV